MENPPQSPRDVDNLKYREQARARRQRRPQILDNYRNNYEQGFRNRQSRNMEANHPQRSTQRDHLLSTNDETRHRVRQMKKKTLN